LSTEHEIIEQNPKKNNFFHQIIRNYIKKIRSLKDLIKNADSMDCLSMIFHTENKYQNYG